ncbi:MAG TPA: hypothetical protein V6C81_22250 [Planktothrix sp.]|jgi:hypothetical protein
MISKTKTVAGLAAMAMGMVVTTNVMPSFAWGGFWHEHPRRAEVLGRDNGLNREIGRDYGHLSGHFGQLKSEDASIRRQEQRDARIDGGHITRGEQRQLNREENNLQWQINRDRS